MRRDHLVDAPGAGDDAQLPRAHAADAEGAGVHVLNARDYRRPGGEPGRFGGLACDLPGHLRATDYRGHSIPELFQTVEPEGILGVGLRVHVGKTSARLRGVRRNPAGKLELDPVLAEEYPPAALQAPRLVLPEPGDQGRRRRREGVLAGERQRRVEDSQPPPALHNLVSPAVQGEYRRTDRLPLLVHEVQPVPVPRYPDRQDVRARDAGALYGPPDGPQAVLPDLEHVALYPSGMRGAVRATALADPQLPALQIADDGLGERQAHVYPQEAAGHGREAPALAVPGSGR